VRHDKEEADIGEQGDNKDIDEKGTFVEREGGKGGTKDPKPFLHLVHGGLENIF